MHYCYKVINEINKMEIFFSKSRYARRYILNEIYLKADNELKKDKDFFLTIKNELKNNKKVILDNFSYSIQEIDLFREEELEELYELLNN
jgi:hypothetical protein